MNNIKIRLVVYLGMLILVTSLIVGILGYVSSMAGMKRIQEQILMDKLESDIVAKNLCIKDYYERK